MCRHTTRIRATIAAVRSFARTWTTDSILIGRYDLNTEFYRLQSAGLFLNSSFGVGPEFSQSGRSGPSIYPNTTFADYRPVRSVVVRAAAFDGLVLGEVAYLFRPSGRELPRDIRFRLGRLAGLPPYKAKVSWARGITQAPGKAVEFMFSAIGRSTKTERAASRHSARSALGMRVRTDSRALSAQEL